MNQAIGRAVFVGLLALYPFIVYFGIHYLPASFFAVLLGVIVGLRMLAIRPEERMMVLPVMALLLVYAVGATIVGRTQALLYYPVLINTLLCVLFALSLFRGDPLLLRVVRARGIPMSEHGPPYMARLTAIWAVFFAANAMIAFWTTTQSLKVWTLYNGLISYLLVGALILCELPVRKYYQHKHRVSNH